MSQITFGATHVLFNARTNKSNQPLLSSLSWGDAPGEYGPHKTLYNRFVRWSEKGIFQKIFLELVAMEDIPEQLQIDATHIKAHRTAASLAKKGINLVPLDAQKAA